MYSWIIRITNERHIHNIVLTVKIDSPKSHHVNKGSTKYDIANAKNLILHAEPPKAADPNLVP